MKTIGIARLKSQLSAHLKQVRRGIELVVVDRDTPVAKIVPIDGSLDDFFVKPPSTSISGLKSIRGHRPRKSFDVFPAVSIPDIFMRRVLDDKERTLFDPKEITDRT